MPETIGIPTAGGDSDVEAVASSISARREAESKSSIVAVAESAISKRDSSFRTP